MGRRSQRVTARHGPTFSPAAGVILLLLCCVTQHGSGVTGDSLVVGEQAKFGMRGDAQLRSCTTRVHMLGEVEARGGGLSLRLAGGYSGTDSEGGFPVATEVVARDAEGGSVVWLHDWGGSGEAAAELLGETLPPQLVHQPPLASQHRNAPATLRRRPSCLFGSDELLNTSTDGYGVAL